MQPKQNDQEQEQDSMSRADAAVITIAGLVVLAVILFTILK